MDTQMDENEVRPMTEAERAEVEAIEHGEVTYVCDRHPSLTFYCDGFDRPFKFENGMIKVDQEEAILIDKFLNHKNTSSQVKSLVRKIDVLAAVRIAHEHARRYAAMNSGHSGMFTTADILRADTVAALQSRDAGMEALGKSMASDSAASRHAEGLIADLNLTTRGAPLTETDKGALAAGAELKKPVGALGMLLKNKGEAKA